MNRQLEGHIRHQRHLAEQREAVRERRWKKGGRKNHVQLVHFDRGATAVSAVTCGDCRILIQRLAKGMDQLGFALLNLDRDAERAAKALLAALLEGGN